LVPTELFPEPSQGWVIRPGSPPGTYGEQGRRTTRQVTADVQLELAGAREDPGGHHDHLLNDRPHPPALGGMPVGHDVLAQDPQQTEDVAGDGAQVEDQRVRLEVATRHAFRIKLALELAVVMLCRGVLAIQLTWESPDKARLVIQLSDS